MNNLTIPLDQAAILIAGERAAALADQHPEIPSFVGKASALLADPARTYTGPELIQLIGAGKTWLKYRPYFVHPLPKAAAGTGNRGGRPAQFYQLDPEKVDLIIQVVRGRRVGKVLDDRQRRLKQQQLAALKAKVDLLLMLVEDGDDPNTALQLTFGAGLKRLELA